MAAKRIQCHSCGRTRLRKFMQRNIYNKAEWRCKDLYSENDTCSAEWDRRRNEEFIANDPWYGW